MTCAYENTYWCNKGKYQELYDRLYKELVPDGGEAATEAGELLRLMSNVYYDVYNNGGCNLQDGWGTADQLEALELAVKRLRYSNRTIFRKIRGYANRDHEPHGKDRDEWDDDKMARGETIESLCGPLDRLVDFVLLQADELSKRKAASLLKLTEGDREMKEAFTDFKFQIGDRVKHRAPAQPPKPPANLPPEYALEFAALQVSDITALVLIRSLMETVDVYGNNCYERIYTIRGMGDTYCAHYNEMELELVLE